MGEEQGPWAWAPASEPTPLCFCASSARISGDFLCFLGPAGSRRTVLWHRLGIIHFDENPFSEISLNFWTALQPLFGVSPFSWDSFGIGSTSWGICSSLSPAIHFFSGLPFSTFPKFGWSHGLIARSPGLRPFAGKNLMCASGWAHPPIRLSNVYQI